MFSFWTFEKMKSCWKFHNQTFLVDTQREKISANVNVYNKLASLSNGGGGYTGGTSF